MGGRDKSGRASSRRMQMTASQQDHMTMLLKQMGAAVTAINGLVCFVRFDLAGTELFYVYNLNDEGAYYLQRVKPCPMSAGVFADVSEIVAYIEADLHALRHAQAGGRLEALVSCSARLTALSRAMEEAFLHSEAPDALLQQAEAALDTLEALLQTEHGDRGEGQRQ